MFRLAPKPDDDDTSDNWSIPSNHKHFNAAVRPRSKLGRRRVVQQNDEKSQEVVQLSGANKPKQLQLPTKHINWLKDDSGIATSESTPSHPLSIGRFGTKFSSSTSDIESRFTPSSRSGRENVFDKFVHPATPCRSRTEPLKEINVPNIPVVDKPANDPVYKDSHGATLHKQLNTSFVSEETMPMVSTEPPPSTTNKTVNETNSDFSNDSSFMTAYDIHRPEPPSNKTFYDPEFFKTPGKNLAEIRIDESPFNPLENFLEESLELVIDNTKTPLSKNVENRIDLETRSECLGHQESDWNKSADMKSDKSMHSGPLAIPLDASQTAEKNLGEARGNGNPDIDHFQGSKFRDDNFKYPSFNHFKTPYKLPSSSTEAGVCTPSINVSGWSEDTTHVTYPQHSKNTLQPKNTFTSQFSLNKSGCSSGDLKALSLANPRSHWATGASSLCNQGTKPGHFSGQTSCSSRPASGTPGKPQRNPEGGHIIKNCQLNFEPSQNKSALEHVGSASYSGSSQESNLTATSSSDKTIVSLKPASETTSYMSSSREKSSNCEDAITVLAQGNEIPRQGSAQQPTVSQSNCSAQQPTVSQPNCPDQPNPLCRPPAGTSVISALIKPQPQNVINIKGTPYTVLSLLGRGGSSQVYQALGPQSSRLMAIKCVDLAAAGEPMAADYLNEIALLSKLQGCPSVIKMFDHEYVEESHMLYVVLEKGDIDFSKLIKNISETKQISMPMIIYYWSEMLNAVHEIHSRGIIHSDLKPANFLLVEGRLKLIDFGIASSLEGDTTSVLKDVPAGTFNYMSPEAITGPKITRKSDVWSMGCILFNLLYGRTPFSHFNQRWTKLQAIADPKRPVVFPKLPHHTPPSLRLALRWCLNKDPVSRPTVEELVKLSELAPLAESGLGKEIDGMMCQYFRKVLPNLKILNEDEDIA